MSIYLRAILTAFIAALAAQGGWLGIVAALIQDYLLPLLGSEKLELHGTFAKGDKAPDEFKSAVRDMLTRLTDRVERPLIRIVLKRIIGSMSDTILDTVWGIVTGASPMPTIMTASGSEEDADLASAALEDVRAAGKRGGVEVENMAAMTTPLPAKADKK